MKDIPGFENRYAIADDGFVFNKKRNKFLKTTNKTGWYLQVTFIHGLKRIPLRPHRLVAEAFLPRVDGLNEVNHKNGIKTDNRVENLEWTNRQKNIQHSYTVLKRKKSQGSTHPKSKLVLDFQTGIYYACAREAAEAKMIKRDDLLNNIKKRQYKKREPMKYGLAFV